MILTVNKTSAKNKSIKMYGNCKECGRALEFTDNNNICDSCIELIE